MERIELSISATSNLKEAINNSAVRLDLEECFESLTQLIQCLRAEYRKWNDYKIYLEGSQSQYVNRTLCSLGERGRPRFEVCKSQIEYLESLSFKWTEIASILGISRMTLYRYVQKPSYNYNKRLARP